MMQITHHLFRVKLWHINISLQKTDNIFQRIRENYGSKNHVFSLSLGLWETGSLNLIVIYFSNLILPTRHITLECWPNNLLSGHLRLLLNYLENQFSHI